MCCFGDGPVEGDKFGQNPRTFHTTMCKAPVNNPLCCCVACLCPWCTACFLRKKVLNDDLSHYTCCQGYFDVCCFRSGKLGEKNCPALCLCLEGCCCQSCAVSATRMYLMEQRQLQSDPCDRRIIRCNNCLQMFSCICSIIACLTGECQEGAECIRRIADIVYCTVQACMQSQVDHELKHEPEPIHGHTGYPPQAYPQQQMY